MKPYYQDDRAGISLYCCDWRALLPELRITNALVLADPCYGQTSLSWDKWDGVWLSAIPVEVRALWCFGSLRMFMDNASDFRSGGWKLSQDIVWEKHNGSSFHNDRFRRVHEQACHFYRGDWATVPHYTPTTPDATRRTVRRKQRPPHMGEIGEGAYHSLDGGPRLQRSVIHARSEHGRAFHPTQKPLAVLKPLIHYGCYRGGTVIVPFSGAGSELVAAKAMGHPAIGCERLEEHCETAALRLSQEHFSFTEATL